MKSIARIISLLVIFLAPIFVFAQPYTQTTTTGYSYGFVSSSGGFGTSCATSGIGCVAASILYIINAILVPLIFAISFLVFLYGVAKKYILSNGESAEVEEGHKLILWGLIGFVVMISVWGLVNVVSNTFGLEGDYTPRLPLSPAP